MKLVLHLLIRRRFLPRWNWLYQQAVNILWRPADTRDQELVTGWIEIGGGATPESVEHFRRWWDTIPPSIVFPNKDET